MIDLNYQKRVTRLAANCVKCRHSTILTVKRGAVTSRPEPEQAMIFVL